MRQSPLHYRFWDYRNDVSVTGGNRVLGNDLCSRRAVKDDVIVFVVNTDITSFNPPAYRRSLVPVGSESRTHLAAYKPYFSRRRQLYFQIVQLKARRDDVQARVTWVWPDDLVARLLSSVSNEPLEYLGHGSLLVNRVSPFFGTQTLNRQATLMVHVHEQDFLAPSPPSQPRRQVKCERRLPNAALEVDDADALSHEKLTPSDGF